LALGGLVALTVLTGACGGTVEGRVSDFATGEPVEGATITAVEHGWGISDGQVVWDKDKSTSVRSDALGAFRLDFRTGSSVHLRASASGYQRFEASYGGTERPHIKLKRRVEGEPRLPDGFLRLGIREDGTMYGWDFSSGRTADSPDNADIFPVSMEEDARGAITFRAAGAGGIRFVSAEELGVDDMFLVFSDQAPSDGYTTTAVIDFSSEGGVYFVRTRDGEHYAKFAFTPHAFAQTLDPGVVRDLSLHYVYDPAGSRDLLYQMPE
jgi:hypothetical protein